MNTTRPNRCVVRGLAAVAGSVLALGAFALPASAHHADEKVEVSKAADLTDGESVKVTFSGFAAGAKPAKVVIAGQGEITTIPDKLNFDEYGAAPSIQVASDGTGSFDFVVTSDHGTVQDGTTLDCKKQQCWIVVVQEPFLPQPNYDSVPITFVGGTVAAPTTATPETTASPTTAAAASIATTDAPTTTVADVAMTSAAATTSVAPTDTAKDSDDSGGSGALYAVIAAVVVVLGGAGFFIAKRKPPVG